MGKAIHTRTKTRARFQQFLIFYVKVGVGLIDKHFAAI